LKNSAAGGLSICMRIEPLGVAFWNRWSSGIDWS
jgi:hypothetical protein